MGGPPGGSTPGARVLSSRVLAPPEPSARDGRVALLRPARVRWRQTCLWLPETPWTWTPTACPSEAAWGRLSPLCPGQPSARRRVVHTSICSFLFLPRKAGRAFAARGPMELVPWPVLPLGVQGLAGCRPRVAWTCFSTRVRSSERQVLTAGFLLTPHLGLGGLTLCPSGSAPGRQNLSRQPLGPAVCRSR